ncbi:MAG: 2OG-Fe(II) oxygenase [Alphaproteobacteria bacterium]|nr:2OG-Fe(II) oxygenase [Alphaproteobacteria bacterium]
MSEAKIQVNVTLLLAGGHSRELRVAADDPLLRTLLASIEDKGDNRGRVPRPYHLHVDNGQRSLIFSGRDLVGILVDPPIVVQDRAAPSAEGQVASPYVLVENFLDPERHAALTRFASEAEPRFTNATVSTGDEDYRRSRVLYEFPAFSALFREKIAALVPQLVLRFGMPSFPIAEVECQMTSHGEGNYFKLHNDSGSPDTATRAISYVYYFFNEPQGFAGGEFRLYHSRVANGAYQCGEHAADIAPRNNSILFFPSYCHHEVLPVRCQSGRFADSRFTVNGWVRRQAAA